MEYYHVKVIFYFRIERINAKSTHNAYTIYILNCYIPQEPENLRFSPVIIFNFNFALLIDIFDNIITYSLYSSVLRHQNFRQ